MMLYTINVGLHQVLILNASQGFRLSKQEYRSLVFESPGAAIRVVGAASQEPRHVEVAWGQVVVVQADGGVAYLHEKELSAKLELLYSKSLYLVALNLATSEEVGWFPSLCIVTPVAICYPFFSMLVCRFAAIANELAGS